MDKPMDVLQEFPVRKSRKQKRAFREAVLVYARTLGYQAQVEKGSFGVQNVVIGNPETAKNLVTAHYDTCAWLPFPNLITPCSFGLFMAWQLLLVIILCVPVGILGGVVGGWLNDTLLAVDIAYLLLVLELILMLFGPANPTNANDNTSGVVSVLELASVLPEELREHVCFVLFDIEEGGLLGSAAYRSKHRKETNSQVVLNLDCVGEGDEILLFPTGKLRKNHAAMERIMALCTVCGSKSITLRNKGFAVYPSDQANFPLGIGIAAFCRSKWAGLYLGKIHTKRDINLDEKNVALLRDFLTSAIRELAHEDWAE